MSIQQSRRSFLKGAAVAGLGTWVTGKSWAQDNSPNERVHFACVGVGGQGEDDSDDAGRLGNVVAICDVDDDHLDAAALRFPGAKKFSDWREMFDAMSNRIDAVTITIPDHSHAVVASAAMHLGKHVFCEKPLAHSIGEVRRLSEMADYFDVATEMGNQGTAANGLRKSAALIQAGALGVVHEVHVWTNRPTSWKQGVPRPVAAPVPAKLHWDLWLGPAPERPYAAGAYHPKKWRGWWDFGTGALGDMACHTVNMPYMALDLRNPTTVEAHTSGTNHDSYPSWSIIKFEFPATPKRAAVTLTWYDGKKKPSEDLLPEDVRPMAESGCIVVGDKGKLYSPGDYGFERYMIGGVDVGEVSFTQSPGHLEELVRAIKGGPAAVSNFQDYAGPLAETILLGNLAVWAEGKKIEWDAKHLRATNAPEVDHIIHPQYRKGYSI